jgi:hypothetical protein
MHQHKTGDRVVDTRQSIKTAAHFPKKRPGLFVGLNADGRTAMILWADNGVEEETHLGHFAPLDDEDT